MVGGEPPVASRCNGLVSGSTGTDPACTSDCSPGLVLGPSCEAVFPEARALQYSLERWRAYLPCSGWVRELPRRYGRLNADRRNRTVVRRHRCDRSDLPLCTCDSVYAWIRLPGVVTDSCGMTVWLRPVSARGLNASLPRRAHPESIELVFYEWPQRYLFSRWVSSLDAFSSYPVSRSCPARALSDNRYTSGDQS